MTAPPCKRLRLLVERHLSGSLTRVELAELEDLLREPAAMDYFLEAAEIEAGLHLLEQPGKESPGMDTTATLVEFRSSARALRFCAAAALALMAGLGALLFIKRPATPPQSVTEQTRTPVAEIIRHIGLRSPAAATVHAGETVSLDRGLAEFRLQSGSRLLVEGPARIGFESLHKMQLQQGRCFIDVPRSNRDLTVSTPHATVRSAGGEFAIVAASTGAPVELGVFEGHVDLQDPLNDPLRVGRGDALRIDPASPPMSIAFPFESIHRRFPSRELAWRAPADSFAPVTIEHSLEGLIWEPGPCRVYFKWMHGPDALIIHSSELLLDGHTVARDVHEGVAGDPLHTRRHAYRFEIPASSYRPGKWSLRTVVQTNPRHLDQVQLPDEVLNPRGVVLLAGDSRLVLARNEVRSRLPPGPISHGVLLVEQGHAAEPYEFCHEWEYVHNGLLYRRTFFENGTARLEREGEILNNFDRATWTVEDGVLTLSICHPDTDDLVCIERHLLRDDGSLLFLDRPYRSARRTGLN